MINDIQKTFDEVKDIINNSPDSNIEYRYNTSIFNKEDAILLIKIINSDLLSGSISEDKMVWYYLWLVSLNYFIGEYETAHGFLNQCFLYSNSQFANALAIKFSELFGYAECYQSWSITETDNIRFHYTNDKDKKIDLTDFIIKREDAFKKIHSFFNVNLQRKIDFFIWNSREEAYKCLNRHLGFAIAQYYLIHSAVDQSIGHEITHIITHYIKGSSNKTSLVCEGTAVLFDESSKNRLEFLKLMLKKHNITEISIKALWDNFFILPSSVAYSLSAVFCGNLLNKFGKVKYIELLKNQTYENAGLIFGADNLENIIKKTELDAINLVRI